MFACLRKEGPDLAALEAAEALVRARYRLSDDDLVLVGEEARGLPGRPETMTTVLFWKGRERHRIAIFKPVAAVTEADLPAGWIAGALRDEGDVDCC